MNAHYLKGYRGDTPAYTDPEDMKAQIADYFDTLGDDDPPTITGIALHLGFASRQSFYDYAKKKAFAYPLLRARLFIENFHEQKLSSHNSNGAIFCLKNMGWSDAYRIDTAALDEYDGDMDPVEYVKQKILDN